MDGARMVQRVQEALTDLGLEFVAEAPIGHYFADFFIPSAKLVVEVDGNCHKIPRQRIRDNAKNQYYKSHGLSYIRLTQAQIEDRRFMLNRIHGAICRITGEQFVRGN